MNFFADFFSHVVVIFICYLQYRKNNHVNRKLCQLVFSIAHRFSTRDGIETIFFIWSMKNTSNYIIILVEFQMESQKKTKELDIN